MERKKQMEGNKIQKRKERRKGIEREGNIKAKGNKKGQQNKGKEIQERNCNTKSNKNINDRKGIRKGNIKKQKKMEIKTQMEGIAIQKRNGRETKQEKRRKGDTGEELKRKQTKHK